VKDAFHEYLIQGNKAAVNPDQMGTKMAAFYPLQLDPGESATLKLRLTDLEPLEAWKRAQARWGFVSRRARTRRGRSRHERFWRGIRRRVRGRGKKKPKNFTPRGFRKSSPRMPKP